MHLGSSLHGLNGFGWMATFMGCNFAVHRRVHTAAMGGFDESFRGGGDDMDFAFRGQLAGHRLGFVADAVVAYRVRDSLRAAARQHHRYGRTRPQLYRKFRASGMPRRSWKHTVRSYGLAVAQAPRLLSADGRGPWVLRVSFLPGMATGSVRDRTIYLSE